MPNHYTRSAKKASQKSPPTVAAELASAVASVAAKRDIRPNLEGETPTKKSKGRVLPVASSSPEPGARAPSPAPCPEPAALQPAALLSCGLGDPGDSKPAALDARASTQHSDYVFILTKGFEVVSGTEQAAVFRKDWGDFIVTTKTFPSSAAANAYAKSLVPSPPSTPLRSVVNLETDDFSPISATDQAKLSEVIASLQAKKPTNRINILFRTNSASHVCVVLVECLNMSGKHQWNVKPELLCEPIKMFPTEFPDDPAALPVIADDVVAQCFYHVQHLVLRDTSAGPDAPLQTKWTSPDKSREITYDQYILATHFDIPVDKLSSTEEEHAFISAKLRLFGASFKSVLSSPLFARLHEANCPKESVWKSMNGMGPKKGGFSFRGYIADANVQVSKCDNLNQYITKMEADKLMALLWDGRKAGTKYSSSK